MNTLDAFNLAVADHQAGRLAEAEAQYRRILADHPDHAGALQLLGVIAHQVGHHEAAIELIRRAIALNPHRADYHANLGAVYSARGQVSEVIACLEQALRLAPNHPNAASNLAGIFKARGQIDQAIECYKKSISQRPQWAEAHWNLGLMLLLKGDFERGLGEYEWRRRVAQFELPFVADRRTWDGSNLNGGRILLYCEQGLGDTIQFVRYFKAIAQRGGRIIFACQTELRRLLEGQLPVEVWLNPDDPLSQIDVQCSLLSLPLAFKTTLDSIPTEVPYIRADAELYQQWQSRLAEDGRRKIGLVWAGRPDHHNDQNRSIALSELAMLGNIRGVHWISLQKGGAAMQAKTIKDLPLTDWTDELNDPADTAALVANLDGVVTVDTFVAHLAGAMGKPIWLLLPFLPDWRWMLNRADSPWYPTIRLFRQVTPRDWKTPVEELSRALAT